MCSNFQTGQHLNQTGYNKWETCGKDSGGACGSITRRGRLAAIDCKYETYFVCEHDQATAKSKCNK